MVRVFPLYLFRTLNDQCVVTLAVMTIVYFVGVFFDDTNYSTIYWMSVVHYGEGQSIRIGGCREMVVSVL